VCWGISSEIQAREDERHGGMGCRKIVRLLFRKNPLNSKSLDVAVGCNKPTSAGLDETVEGLRKPEGGA